MGRGHNTDFQSGDLGEFFRRWTEISLNHVTVFPGGVGFDPYLIMVVSIGMGIGQIHCLLRIHEPLQGRVDLPLRRERCFLVNQSPPLILST